MANYYVKSKEGKACEVSDFMSFKPYLIHEDEIAEHLSAQIEYYRTKEVKKLDPIYCSVNDKVFNMLLNVLKMNFSDLTFDFDELIEIKVKEESPTIIVIINSDK